MTAEIAQGLHAGVTLKIDGGITWLDYINDERWMSGINAGTYVIHSIEEINGQKVAALYDANKSN